MPSKIFQLSKDEPLTVRNHLGGYQLFAIDLESDKEIKPKEKTHIVCDQNHLQGATGIEAMAHDSDFEIFPHTSDHTSIEFTARNVSDKPKKYTGRVVVRKPIQK